MKKSPSDADRHIGRRIRARRIAVGMSQEKLGDALGLTFQQVQKYEKGMNRVGAGRLLEIGAALGVPVEYFFEGLQDQAPTSQADLALHYVTSTFEGVRLMRAFAAVDDVQLQRKIVELVETVLDVNRAAKSYS